MTALQHLFPQRMTAYVLTIHIFVFMRTIIVPPPTHTPSLPPTLHLPDFFSGDLGTFSLGIL